MDSVHHYRPRNPGLHCDRRPTARGKGENLTVLRPSEKLSEFLQDDDCTSNGLNSTRDHDCSNGEDDNFSPAKKLLLNNGEAQECQRIGLSDEYIEGTKGSFGHTPESDCSGVASHRSSEDEYEDGQFGPIYMPRKSFSSILVPRISAKV